MAAYRIDFCPRRKPSLSSLSRLSMYRFATTDRGCWGFATGRCELFCPRIERCRNQGLPNAFEINCPEAQASAKVVQYVVDFVEQVGEDRRVQARIVELDREIGAPVLGFFRSCAADLGASVIDPVAGRVLAGAGLVRRDAQVLGLETKGDDGRRDSRRLSS